ncbi:hypothetical protein [Lutibacter sp.]|uniref:hypothetical protein n=1 Tax=Lutibacter sp. TaxID=1925666 RepID=UPI001A1BA71A|nr:hypothetical protein [Lutibacter sp.]MBI9042007.1 hypothetical protein [Lutibacter sp.]
MLIENINIKNEPFLFDKVGRVVIKEDKVLRIITNDTYIKLYKELLNSPDINNLFSKGLIETKIYSESKEDSILILEHKKINFMLHPSEYTNKMFWDVAYMYISLCKELYNNHGILTVDAHPWNVTFEGTKATFFDFSSLYKGNVIGKNWIDEFGKYFAIPIRLASISKKTFPLSLEYRREHLNGFGLSFLNKRLIKKLFNKKFESISKYKGRPNDVFDKILDWLDKNKPINAKNEYWLNYEQSHLAEIGNPKTIKQKFVHKILSTKNPKTVLDLASNKGYYALMAEKLGASVMAFDYEEETINQCYYKAIDVESNITSALMNFYLPTPPMGVGLMSKSAFDRLGSNIVLALALVHHICLVQRIPVYIFCEICKKYAKDGVMLEFIDPNDLHVKSWNADIPIDYNIDSICNYMKDKFPNVEKSENMINDGINRQIMYFYN